MPYLAAAAATSGARASYMHKHNNHLGLGRQSLRQSHFSSHSDPCLSPSSPQPATTHSPETPSEGLRMVSRKNNDGQVQGTLEGVTHHIVFRSIVNAIVFLSTVQIGLESDYKGGDWDIAWDICAHIFAVAFTLEFLVKLYALRWQYFYDAWNVLDLFIAFVSVVDTWILPLILTGEGSERSLGVVRVFRLLRLLRIAKMMKGIPEFTMVVEGLAASMKAVFWIFVLLFCILYACAICCVEVIGSNHIDYPAYNPKYEAASRFNAFMYFGTVARSLLSLTNMVFLTEWHEIVRPVFEKQFVMAIFLSLLVIVSVFGILNVIIGVVVERTLKAMEAVQASEEHIIKQKQMSQAEILADLAYAADKDGSATLCREEMESLGDFEKLEEMLCEIDFPYDFTFQELFAILDADGDGFVSKSEFVTGIMRLIWCDDFQRDCLLNCAIGQIKQSAVETRIDVKKQIQDLHADLRALREQLSSSSDDAKPRPNEQKERKLVHRTISSCSARRSEANNIAASSSSLYSPSREQKSDVPVASSPSVCSSVKEQKSEVASERQPVKFQDRLLSQNEDGLIDLIPKTIMPIDLGGIDLGELWQSAGEVEQKGDALIDPDWHVVGFLPIVRAPPKEASPEKCFEKRSQVPGDEVAPLLGVLKPTLHEAGNRHCVPDPVLQRCLKGEMLSVCSVEGASSADSTIVTTCKVGL